MEDHGVVSLVHSMSALHSGKDSKPQDLGCGIPPAGWFCSRMPGHEGPCAAYPIKDSQTTPPDPKRHLSISISKSIVRIFGFAFLFIPALFGFGLCLLIGAELLGIVEELV